MFTVKVIKTMHPGNMVQETYSCGSYTHETRGSGYEASGPVDPKQQHGPTLTLRDGSGEQALIIPIPDGAHVYIENDRGKTIDHFIGIKWLPFSEYDAANEMWGRENSSGGLA
jgi:hypothetical protein